MDGFLETHRDELINLVLELVAVDSQIPPHADERAIVDLLRRRVDDLALGASEIVSADPRRPNLLVRIPGVGEGPTLVLNGHLDTKPVGDARDLWTSDPLRPELRDGRIYGLGAADMKAAVAAMVFAAAALRDSGSRLKGDLILAFTADEEAGGGYGSKFVAPLLADADACLIGEPSGWDHDWQGLHVVSRGVSCFRVRVRGTQTHSSLSDRMASVNVAQRMAELLLGINDELDLRYPDHPLGGRPTLNAGVIVRAGGNFGVLPGSAEFACDLRTVPGMTEAEVRTSLERWLDRRRAITPGLDVEFEFEPGLPWLEPSEIAADHPLVAATRAAAAAVLGESPPLSVFPGGTDAPWFDQAGIPTLPAFGPGVLTCCHGPNEYVDVASVHQAARIYARIAANYCGTTDRG